jgi:hypothetical protein
MMKKGLQDLGEAQLTAIKSKISEIVLVLEKSDGDPYIDTAVRLGMSRGWWTPELKESLVMTRWNAYRTMLLGQSKTPQVVQSVDDISDTLMDCIENPRRTGTWTAKGLVVGNVQSGKTQNYIGLAAKAYDAGYRLVIVLAGMHDSLRVQTQNRIDQGLVGVDSGRTTNPPSFRVGIALDDPEALFPAVETVTHATSNGDFKISLANGIWNKQKPTIMVVKKNAAILRNVITWLTAFDENNGSGIDAPVLIIDDEADNASINIGTSENPATINKLIRSIITKFNKASYVGYTATPFANVLQNPEDEHDEYGHNLFPNDFIIRLPEPQNYIGASKIFGISESVAGAEVREPLPGLIQFNDDARVWLPAKHRKTHFADNPDLVQEFPDSLRDAVCSFALAGAVRDLREAVETPNSMLIHVSPWVMVQDQLVESINDYLDEIKMTLIYGQGTSSPIWDRLLRLHKQAKNTTQWYLEHDEYYKKISKIPDWPTLQPALAKFIDRVELKLINGQSTDVIDYSANPSTAVIALGGNKLSRGLTLEGLSVSYYLRESDTYDTLMQMGRWFGYRDGYIDMCRLYATPGLVADFADIALASEELYASLDELAMLGNRTPMDFALKVRAHPGRLKVTAAQRMKGAIRTSVNYAGTISETTIFLRDALAKTNNIRALDSLMGKLGSRISGSNYISDSSYRVYSSTTEAVVEFFRKYQRQPSNYRVDGELLNKYIQSRSAIPDIEKRELTEWHVLVASPSGEKQFSQIKTPDGESISMVIRTGNEKRGNGTDRFAFARLVTPEHELYDCAPDSMRWNESLEFTKRLWKEKQAKISDPSATAAEPNSPIPKSSRLTRKKDIGLLMIYVINPISDKEYSHIHDDPYVGFAVSFPGSSIAGAVEWMLNPYFEDLEKD